MTTYIALLRGINVGGRNMISMSGLRDLAQEAGFSEPRTLLQSGNLLFGAEPQAPPQIEAILEAKIRATLSLDVDCHVRTSSELATIVAGNPYVEEARQDPSHLLVVFFKSPPTEDRWSELSAAIRGREYFAAKGREAYFVYPDGIGDSKLTSAMIDARIGLRGTARNWNTVLKLLAMSGDQKSF